MRKPVHLPPLIAEIGRVEAELTAAKNAAVSCFLTVKQLNERHQELLRWARTGWATPSNDPTRTPPAAPAMAKAA